MFGLPTLHPFDASEVYQMNIATLPNASRSNLLHLSGRVRHHTKPWRLSGDQKRPIPRGSGNYAPRKLSHGSERRDLAAILFDKDGTLIDYEKTWAPINRRAACIAASGNEDLERAILEVCGIDPVSGRTIPDSLFAAGNASEIALRMVSVGSPIPPDILAGKLDSLFLEAAGKAIAVTDLRRLFTRLKQDGYRLGIASSDSEAAIRRTAISQEIADQLDFIAGYDSGFGTKPEPGMVHGFCRKIGCEPAKVAVVGDNLHDLVMARAAGAGLAVAVLSGTGTRATLPDHADICIATIAELPEILKNLLNLPE
jgi:phosphoglycolate phosphatase